MEEVVLFKGGSSEWWQRSALEACLEESLNRGGGVGDWR